MITRKDYMNNDHPATHSDYYRDVIKGAGLKPNFDAATLRMLRTEYDGGNIHFNSLDSSMVDAQHKHELTLRAWDARAFQVAAGSVHRALKERGDYLTMAGQTCIIKELARIALEESCNV